MSEKCTEIARVRLPWAGEIGYYCPIHANQMALLAQTIGAPIKAELLPKDSTRVCDSHDPLTYEEKELAKEFPL